MAYCRCHPVRVYDRLQDASKQERLMYRTARQTATDGRLLASTLLRRHLNQNNDTIDNFSEVVASLADRGLFKIQNDTEGIVVCDDSDIFEIRITG